MAKFFKDHNMYLHIKTKFGHSNLVENSIRTIKRALYFILRRKKSKNWSKYLSSAVNTVNYNYNPAIGGLQPAKCNEDLALGDLLITDRLKKLGKKSSHLLTIEEQRKFKNDIEKDPKFKEYLPEKAVLLNLPLSGPKEFKKETSPKHGQAFLIHSLDFRQKPVMFKLKTLNGNRIKGK